MPAILGSLAGYAVYVVAADAGLTPIWHFPVPAALRSVDLLWAVAAGVGGALVAIAFTYLCRLLRAALRRAASGPAPRDRRPGARRPGTRVELRAHVRRGADQRDRRAPRWDDRVLRARRAGQARRLVGDAVVRVARRVHHPALLHRCVPRARVPRARTRHQRGGHDRRVHGCGEHRRHQDADRINARGHRRWRGCSCCRPRCSPPWSRSRSRARSDSSTPSANATSSASRRSDRGRVGPWSPVRTRGGRVDDEQAGGAVVRELVRHAAEDEPAGAGHPAVADHQQVRLRCPWRR